VAKIRARIRRIYVPINDVLENSTSLDFGYHPAPVPP
jgi:hypothetical protein